MGKVEVKCSDGKISVECVNPLFSNIEKIDPSISTREMEGVDIVFSQYKEMNAVEFDAYIGEMDLVSLMRLHRIVSVLKIEKLMESVSKCISGKFQRLKTPLESRELLKISNQAGHEENKTLLQVFGGILAVSDSSDLTLS